MPRYYFNIRNGDNYNKDSVGTNWADLGTVRDTAIARVRKLSAKDRKQTAEAESEITDEGGIIVEAVRFSEASK
jgi:hypothetical protein